MKLALQRIFFCLVYASVLACDSGPISSPSESARNLSTTVEDLLKRIEENIKAEDHEAYIRNYIDLLDQVQHLTPGSDLFWDARWKLIHYANKFGLYHQGIELTEEMLAHVRQDTSAASSVRKERIHAALAGFYFELRQYEKALQAYYRVWHYMDLNYGNQEHISLMNNIGMAFQRAGNVDSAMYFFKRVDSILSSPRTLPFLGEFKHDEIFSGSVKDNLASLLSDQGLAKEAEKLYRENFSMYGKYDQHPVRYINAGIRLAHLYLQSGEYTELKHTIVALDSLFRMLSYPGEREQELDYYQILAQYYMQTGSASIAGGYQRLSMHLADSLYMSQLESTRLLSNELMAYKARHFSEQLDHEKRETILNRQKAQSRLWLLLILVIFSIAGGLLLTISYRQRLRLARKQAELKEMERQLAAAHARAMEQEKDIMDVALQHKKKDLSTMALDAMIKKEWAEKLDGLLTQAEQSRGHKRSISLRKLREEIRSHIHADHRLSQLQENIETLSAEFYDHLKALNPDLSKTEVRLVSFLKLRLSNDEIAMFQGISTKSVIMSRYRLRKKLGLPESADLDAFCREL